MRVTLRTGSSSLLGLDLKLLRDLFSVPNDA